MIEEILNFIENYPQNINIEYSNIDGKEKLIINGKEINGIINRVKKYKENLDLIDDCLFEEIMNNVSEDIDMKKFDELLEKDNYTKDEVTLVESYIDYINEVIKDTIKNKINKLIEIYNKFDN